MEKEQEKWSWHKFFVGLSKLFFSKGPAVWIIATALAYRAIDNGFSDTVKITLIVVWGVISLSFYFSEPLATLISSGKLNVDVKAGAEISAKPGGK